MRIRLYSGGGAIVSQSVRYVRIAVSAPPDSFFRSVRKPLSQCQRASSVCRQCLFRMTERRVLRCGRAFSACPETVDRILTLFFHEYQSVSVEFPLCLGCAVFLFPIFHLSRYFTSRFAFLYGFIHVQSSCRVSARCGQKRLMSYCGKIKIYRVRLFYMI